MEPPEPRYKSLDELTVDELAERHRALAKGDREPKFETDEYAEYRAHVLRKAGLDDEANEAEPGGRDLDELSPSELYTRVKKETR